MTYPIRLAAGGLLLSFGAWAQEQPTPVPPEPAIATVTITNLSKGQILTPAVIFSHGPEVPPLFIPGEPSSPELSRLAEIGSTHGLANRLRAEPNVLRVQTLQRFIHPGKSASMEVAFDRDHRLVSLASMIEITNDGFIALEGAEVPCEGSTVVMLGGWDAGSERNTEQCAHVPAPCPRPARRGTCSVAASAEGFVHVHAGIFGCGGFAAEQYDWNDPLARITVTPSETHSPPGALVAACVDEGPAPPPSELPGTGYAPLDGWSVSDGLVRFLALTSEACLSLSSPIDGVQYEVHRSVWQMRATEEDPWMDVRETEMEGSLCAFSPTTPGQYRAVAEISIDGVQSAFSTENVIEKP